MSSSTSTSLTLRALLKTAAGRLGLGVPGRSVSGLTPAAKGLFAAAALDTVLLDRHGSRVMSRAASR